ncbi:MAG TPA: alkaline phosphatase family protein [Pirellulales bacterium]|jgi:predicted AlkP superfamily phosphohydrolase/phosphomutase|nr:alkaline phosphatase family protein [Pirellulales bacterium]
MRTVLFGLDGATYTVLDALMAQGIMPALKKFCESGVRCELESTPLPITPQAWTTLATGRSMGYHGVHDFVRAELNERGMMLRFNTSRDNHCQTIWKYLSEHGRRVTVLNYFGLAPADPVNGHTMPGFVPGRYLRRSSYPADLFDRLKSLPQFDVSVLGLDLDVEKEGLAEMPPERWSEWINLHIQRERAWFSTLEYLMEHEPSDLSAIVFDGVDKLQHLAYRYLDPKYVPAEPTAWEREIIDLCHQYFRQVDGFLARTLELVGPQGRVFIASDHGFTASTEIVYINRYLHDLGLLHWTREMAEDDRESIVVERLTQHTNLFDWEKTRAAALTPSCNGVYIMNVPPEEYTDFREELIAHLLALRGPDGQPVIAEIKKREEWFAGPYMGHAPDLTLTLRDHGFLSVLHAAQPVATRSAAVGTHHPQGVLIGHGVGLKQNARVEGQNILDVAGLLVHSVGLPIPAEYEGEFPARLFDPQYLAEHPPRFGALADREDEMAPAVVLDDADSGGMDPEDELALTHRLRSLGYIE